MQLLLQIEGTLAAVDATQHKTVSDRYKIQGFPTGILYFNIMLF